METIFRVDINKLSGNLPEAPTLVQLREKKVQKT